MTPKSTELLKAIAGEPSAYGDDIRVTRFNTGGVLIQRKGDHDEAPHSTLEITLDKMQVDALVAVLARTREPDPALPPDPDLKEADLKEANPGEADFPESGDELPGHVVKPPKTMSRRVSLFYREGTLRAVEHRHPIRHQMQTPLETFSIGAGHVPKDRRDAPSLAGWVLFGCIILLVFWAGTLFA